MQPESGINWMYYPKNIKCPEHLISVVRVFQDRSSEISSGAVGTREKNSNEVLKAVSQGLEMLGYETEKNKTKKGKISRPVLFGKNGEIELKYEVDAYSDATKTVIEVEAGQAVMNYKFLKDIIEACLIADSEYLVIAVRNEYYTKKKEKEQVSHDFSTVVSSLDAIYASQRISFMLKGIMIIGY